MIGEAVIYFLKVLAIQGVFYLFYWLLLRNQTNHSLNRIFLLSTVLISLVIPFIESPFSVDREPLLETTMLHWIAEPVSDISSIDKVSSSSKGIGVWMYLTWFYYGVVVLMIARSIFHLYLLQKLKKHCEYVKRHWFKLFKTPHSRPFSFFSNVFIPKDLFGSQAFNQILAHECVHVKQHHSIDRLLVDFLVSLFWFNPFIYLYRNALIEIHEYQADAEVISEYNDLVGYQEILYDQLRAAPYSGLVSHFNFSTIKKRIVMMNKSKSQTKPGWAYALTVPVLALVFLSFTSKKSDESVTAITDRIEDLTGPFDLLPAVDEPTQKNAQDDNYRPSILPLKPFSKFKMSSGFGMRVDPKAKSRKMHKGMDLATPVGTVVLATADGVVHETENMKESYGKIVVILHGKKYMTRYAQLSEFKVKKGDKVKRGQVIALSGNSGRSTGPHLHYEIYENDKVVDPAKYIKNYKFSSTQVPPPPLSKELAEPKIALHKDGDVHEDTDPSEAEPAVDGLVILEHADDEMEEGIDRGVRAESIELAEEAESLAVLAKVKATEAMEVAIEASEAAEELNAEQKAELAERAGEMAVKMVLVEEELKKRAEAEERQVAELAKVRADEERIRIEIKQKTGKEKLNKEKEKEKSKNKEKNKDK